MKKKILLSGFMVCLLFMPLYGQNKANNPIEIVVTTSHLEVMVRKIGREQVEVISLIPGGTCPGHFDLDPETVKKISSSKIFISHYWEKRFDNILDGLGNKQLVRKYARTEGNWMVPEVQRQACREIAAMLFSEQPDRIEEFKENLNNYENEIRLEEKRILHRFSKWKDTKVICSKHQEEFLKWLDFEIVATYEEAEDFNLRQMSDIMKKGKEAKVKLIIDNLQNGPNIGMQMAKDLKVSHVVLSNFPLDHSYIGTLKNNANEIERKLR